MAISRVPEGLVLAWDLIHVFIIDLGIKSQCVLRTRVDDSELEVLSIKRRTEISYGGGGDDPEDCYNKDRMKFSIISARSCIFGTKPRISTIRNRARKGCRCVSRSYNEYKLPM